MTSQSDARKVIERLFCSHFVEILKVYNVDLVPSDGLVGSDKLLFCGVIGFSGEGIRGSIAVAGSGALLVASNPIPDGAPRDWVAELANQLMGNVKSRLLGYGVEVYMSTPIVLRGERLALEVRGDDQPRIFTDGAARGTLTLWIDVETTPAFEMSSEENTALSGLDGGVSLMF